MDTHNYREAQPVLTEAPQCETQPSSSPSSTETGEQQQPYVNHPAAFSFPTLTPDGSVEDIRIRRTPPAALSSLGAKMSERDAMSDSAFSFADSQYDMVDDASETSNDDHETASLNSTERGMSDEGALTPEDGRSVVDEDEEEVESLPQGEEASMRDSADDLARDVALRGDSPYPREELNANRMMDSFLSDLSDDLETPRQSTMPTFGTGSPSRPSPAAKITSADREFNILLISERTVPEAEVTAICRKITTSLAGANDDANCQVIKLPVTPSGICSSTATIYRHGNVQVNVQQCIGADTKHGPESPSLHILDSDGEHSSVYTVGGGIKPKFKVPSFAILYCTKYEERAEWFKTAELAIRSLKVGVLSIDAEDDGIMGVDNGDLRDCLSRKLFEHKIEPTTTVQEPKAKEVMPKIAKQSGSGFMTLLLGLTIVMLPALLMLGSFWPIANPVTETAVRREALGFALGKMMNTTDATKTFNLEHLVPQPTATSANFLGQQEYSMPYASYYQGASPNHVIVSLTKKPGKMLYPSPKTVRVYKGGRDIAFNQTKLINGIYDISIEPTEAYGLVNVDMLTVAPYMNFSMEYNFGNRIFQRKTYGKAGTDLSKTVNKDLTVARKAAKSLGEKIQLEISAGAAATKNVTTQLAVYVARDLQVFTNTAVSLLGKMGQVPNNTATAIRKDLVLVQKEIVAIGTSIQKSAMALVPSKEVVVAPIKLSRERALAIQRKYFGPQQQKVANSTSASKELSIYFQDFFKPGTTAKKPSSLRDIARCLPARDFAACQKKVSLAADASPKMTSSLSTVPGKGLTHQETTGGKQVSARDAKAREDLKKERDAAKGTDGQLRKLAKEQAAADEKAAKLPAR